MTHGTSGQNATKIVYKADNGQEFFVIANPGMAAKWRKNKTTPLIDVVQGNKNLQFILSNY